VEGGGRGIRGGQQWGGERKRRKGSGKGWGGGWERRGEVGRKGEKGGIRV